MSEDAPVEKRGTGTAGFWLLLSLLALLAAAKVVLGDTLDPDCFWHLRVGEEIARAGWPPRPLVDDLSFASVRRPWTPYSWLAELGMKKLWDAGGFRAAIAVQAGMEAAFILLMGLAAVELSAAVYGEPRRLAAALGAAFGGILSLAYLSFRPVTAALAILAFIAWLLLRDRRLNQRSKAVWTVVPLTVLLINIHFFAIFVPLWTGALMVGDAIQRKGSTRRGAILFVLTLAACAMTPLLPGTIRSVLDYSTQDVMVRAGGIAEFRPFYSGIMGNISAAVVIALVIGVIWRAVRPPRIGVGEALWFFGCAILLFRMGRMAPVFAIIAVPLFAVVVPRLSDRILARPPIVMLLAVAVGLTAWKVASEFPRSNDSLSAWLDRNGPDAPNYPCMAADFVEENIPGQTHHLINEFTWGGFLEWRLGGRFQTLMDGRTQLFSPEFWNSTMLGSARQRKEFLAATPADAAIVRASGGKFEAVLTQLGWKIVYRDRFAEVLTPPNSGLAAISGSE